ncbi:MAG: hypothetical protein ACJAUD_002691 [Crocinitomicaceae bacterium]|jgi:hypothetical protein
MELSELSESDKSTFISIIDAALVEQTGLALISRRLQNKGLSHESSKELIQKVALEKCEGEKRKAMLYFWGGLAALIILGGLGYQSSGRRNLYLYAVGAFLGGSYMYLKSTKRAKYLKSIFDKLN